MSDLNIVLLFFSILALLTLLFNSIPIKIKGVKGIQGINGFCLEDYPNDKKYRLRGYRGYFGIDFDNSEHDKKLRQADILVDVYNSKINTFDTEEENDKFAEEINKDIEKIINN